MKYKACRRYLNIAYINLRHNFLPHLGLAVLLIVLTPVLFGINDLDARAAAVPLEFIVALCGIILLTPVFFPEQNQEIREAVEARYTSHVSVCVIRVCYALLFMILIVGFFCFFMYLQHSDVGWMHFSGTMASAVFLGGMGVLSGALFRTVPVSYMLPILYYALCFGGGKEYLGPFYLFTMVGGNGEGKMLQLTGGICLIALGIIVEGRKK